MEEVVVVWVLELQAVEFLLLVVGVITLGVFLLAMATMAVVPGDAIRFLVMVRQHM